MFDHVHGIHKKLDTRQCDWGLSLQVLYRGLCPDCGIYFNVWNRNQKKMIAMVAQVY